MLKIIIRFYEELNDFIKIDYRKKDNVCSYYGRRSVKDLIESYGVPHVEVDLILVNGMSVGFDHLVEDGDRVSVYPVFERLDIKGVTRLRETPLRDPRFIADINIGKLVKYMRMLGFDVLYGEIVEDEKLAEISSASGRILLTLDHGLLMRKNVNHGMLLRSRDPKEQCIEVVERLDLWNVMKPFSRCMRCNQPVKEIEADSLSFEKISNLVPPMVKEWCREFTYCPECNKVYWRGTHMRNMEDFIYEIIHKRVIDNKKMNEIKTPENE
jgi:hypothetical protein